MFALGLVMPAWAGVGSAGVSDHLKCYRLKVKKGVWTANAHAVDPLILDPMELIFKRSLTEI